MHPQFAHSMTASCPSHEHQTVADAWERAAEWGQTPARTPVLCSVPLQRRLVERGADERQDECSDVMHVCAFDVVPRDRVAPRRKRVGEEEEIDAGMLRCSYSRRHCWLIVDGGWWTWPRMREGDWVNCDVMGPHESPAARGD